jgi:hypothetical protein
MAESQGNEIFVRVKDRAGNDFLCPLNALKDPKDINEEELDHCVDDATVGRYAGKIKIADYGVNRPMKEVERGLENG